MVNITMSKKECKQIKVFEKLEQNSISQVAAAKMLNLSTRQIRNKLRRYKASGVEGLIHRNRGSSSSRKWCAEKRKHAISLLRSDWIGFGPTFACEKLQELEGIVISRETVRKEMIKEMLWKPRKQKIKYRMQRIRKFHLGEMIQLDGSPHDWFEGRAPKCTLLVFIDDATSKTLWLEFVKSESMKEVFIATKKYMEKHGRPISLYVDFGSVWSVNTNNPDREKLTQFERAMKELDVRVIHAHSPQAKGRVERSNKTFQDRLIKEMRLAQISSIDSANNFVQTEYINKHNARFSVQAQGEGNVHRSIEGFDLENVFCSKEERVLQNNFTIRYKKRTFQLHKQQPTIIRPKNKIIVNEHLDSSIYLFIRRTNLDFSEVENLPQLDNKSEKNNYWQISISEFLQTRNSTNH